MKKLSIRILPTTKDIGLEAIKWTAGSEKKKKSYDSCSKRNDNCTILATEGTLLSCSTEEFFIYCQITKRSWK